MARFSAKLRLCSPAGDSAAGQPLQERLSATIQAADLAVAYLGPAGLTAQITDRRDPCDQRLVLSWGQASSAPGAIAVEMELQSHEAMAGGAPITRSSFSHLLQTLQQQLPGLEVLQRSDHP